MKDFISFLFFRHKILTVFLLQIFAFPLYSAEIISPVNGKFANKQSLVINLAEDEEAFYSYTSSEPLDSGFAYDGPVLIDAAGEVNLSIVVMNGEGKSNKVTIKYTVSEKINPYADSTAEKKFIDRISSENIVSCSSKNAVLIPSSLSFSIGNGEKHFLKGTSLSVSSENRLSRYVPCLVTNGSLYWRFIILLNGGAAETLTKSSVPFEISDWENFKFTGQKLIWCLDNGFWSASKDEIKIDRTKTHVIYWQDVAYDENNPVQSFVLPPKPAILSTKTKDGVSFGIDGDERYKMSVKSGGTECEVKNDSAVFKSVVFDTVSGDFINATAIFSLYIDGVFQGNISHPYKIDKQPPLPPKFVASEDGEYARKDVNLKIESEKDSKVFYLIYGPFEVKSNSYLDSHSELDYIKPDNTKFLPYKNQNFSLRAGNEKTVSYKAFSYAEDAYGNKSEISSYQVIIDEYNYFIDGNAAGFGADGSRLHPYNSFSQALKAVNSSKFVHFFVSGAITLSSGANIITSNCSFTGMNDACFIIPSDSYLLVQDSSLEIQNCVIQKELADSSSIQKSEQKFLIFERAAAFFEDCEIIGKFDSSGIAVKTDASIVNFRKSGLTVSSPVYCCGFSGNNSRFSILDSHFAAISDTAVNFSVKGGSFELQSSECKVISHLGRVLESIGSNLTLVSNRYTGDFDQKNKNEKPVWKDQKSLVLEDKNNMQTGFGEKL